MKFVSNKKVTDHALRHFEIQQEQAELRAKLRALDEEKKALEEFLNRRTQGTSFQFADAKDYLMELDFNERSRTDIDGEAVRRHYAKIGRKVPMQTSEWVEVKTRYITE